MTCGEQCSAEARAAVADAWGIDVYDYWGCSEGVYAFPCEAGEAMHLPDDLAIIEPVDSQGRVVAPGQPAAKILLTNLYNKTEPLIRYEITDAMTVSSGSCECGCAHRRIEDLAGRTDSFFVYEGGAAVHWIGMTTVLLGDPEVVELQVTQTLRGADISVATKGACNVERLRRGLAELMAKSGLPDPQVTISRSGRVGPTLVRQAAAVSAFMTRGSLLAWHVGRPRAHLRVLYRRPSSRPPRARWPM